MKHKYKNFELKSAGEDKGEIAGYFATSDRIPDSYGDVIAPGAFTETIQKRKESGHPFPLCWNHDLDQIIGMVEEIEDEEKGPWMKASFFDTELAQEKRELVKTGVVYQFSFAYDILEAGEVTLEENRKAYELRKLDLFEISIVPIPANPRAEMTEVKAGKRNSKSDEDIIRQIIALAEKLLNEPDDTEDPEDEEDKAKANAAAKELEQRNSSKKALLELIENIDKTEE